MSDGGSWAWCREALSNDVAGQRDGSALVLQIHDVAWIALQIAPIVLIEITIVARTKISAVTRWKLWS